MRKHHRAQEPGDKQPMYEKNPEGATDEFGEDRRDALAFFMLYILVLSFDSVCDIRMTCYVLGKLGTIDLSGCFNSFIYTYCLNPLECNEMLQVSRCLLVYVH